MDARMALRTLCDTCCKYMGIRRSRLSCISLSLQSRYLSSLLPQATEMEIYTCIRVGREDRGNELERKGVEKIQHESPFQGFFCIFLAFLYSKLNIILITFMRYTPVFIALIIGMSLCSYASASTLTWESDYGDYIGQ